VNRLRIEPPRFRRVRVRRSERRTPRLVGVTLAGDELEGFAVDRPAASVRLLLPSPSSGGGLVMPEWNGNEFLLPDGNRPVLRTFTPRRVDTSSRELDIEIVDHGHGVASEWARAAREGDEAAVSGPGRGYEVDAQASAFVLAGDETALPAIDQLLEVLPRGVPVQVHVEIADQSARLDLATSDGVEVTWHQLPAGARPGDALVDAVRSATIAPEARVWVAGEAAAVQRIRKHLFEDRGMSRSQATVRGYWKHGRAGASDT
jgi:NADPH-dependent ferric siderophore reductase